MFSAALSLAKNSKNQNTKIKYTSKWLSVG